MNGRRAVVGLCMLCALLVSAFAAQSASAAGTTAYTCTAGGNKDYAASDVHCVTNKGANNGTLGHVSIANNTKTTITGNNKDGAGNPITGFLVATLFGTTVELEGKGLSGSGSMTNSESGGEMIASGEGTITFTEVSVVKPANCTIQTDVLPSKEKGEVGVIHTEPLKASTAGAGDGLKFEPKEGTAFARFWMTGESCALKNTTFTATGSVTGTPEGATTKFTEAGTTAENTLKLNGAKAGLSGSLTIEGKHSEQPSDTYKPLTATT